MMNQPELGKKIAELRKAKGFTQEELVEQCNLNVRTLQRIESGEVSPRIYTLKMICAALDYTSNDLFENGDSGFSKTVWLGHFYRNLIDLFNLKTNTMKKIAILVISLTVLGLGIFLLSSKSGDQHGSGIKRIIEVQNRNSVRWFNSGQIDSLVSSYSDNACFYRANNAPFCGKNEIYQCLQNAVTSNLFKMIDIEIISVNVAADIAVEKSITRSRTPSAEIVETINLQEWHFTDGKWLIVNDIDVLIK
jgi:DNA-binding XRE family transcriptional regulator/ketosteroid isomerase-like protein